MSKKIVFPVLIALVLALFASSSVLAAGSAAKSRAKADIERFRTRGLVTAVDAAAGTFSIKGKEGQVSTFSVVDQTRYKGEISSLADLKAGMLAGVAVRKQGDHLYAVGVIARTSPERFAGKVTSVDQSQGTFELAAHSGQSLTIHTNGDTKFNSPNGSVKSLADLQADMLAGVRVVPQADGSYLAKAVLAGKVKADVRMAGKVTATGEQSFTILNGKGQTITFQVNGETRYKRLNGGDSDFKNLKAGMKIGVAAQKQADGTFLATVVLVGKEK